MALEPNKGAGGNENSRGLGGSSSPSTCQGRRAQQGGRRHTWDMWLEETGEAPTSSHVLRQGWLLLSANGDPQTPHNLVRVCEGPSWLTGQTREDAAVGFPAGAEGWRPEMARCGSTRLTGTHRS